MTGRLSKNFHGVGIGPLSKILAVKEETTKIEKKKLVKMQHHENKNGFFTKDLNLLWTM